MVISYKLHRRVLLACLFLINWVAANARTNTFLLDTLGAPNDTSQAKKKEKWFKFSGHTGATYEFYHVDTVAGSGFRARRPKHLMRLVFAPTITLGKRIVLPFEVNVSSVATNVTTPVEHYRGQYDKWYGLFNQFKNLEDVKNYLINPINRVGFAPSFGKIKLYAGTQTPQYSELTIGNVSMFGLGMDIKTKWFFISANSGYAQHAIERDTTTNIVGAYQRTQSSVRLGLGNIEKSYIAFNASFSAEDGNSVKNALKQTAQTGFTGSLEYQIKIKKAFRWKTEIAACVRTSINDFYASPFLTDSAKLVLREKYNKPLEENLPAFVVKNYPFNPSTSADLAASTALNIFIGKLNIDAKGLYVGPGFKPVGYPFFVSDRFDATLGTRFALFRNHVSFNGTFGKRITNLSKKLETGTLKLPTFTVGKQEVSLIAPSPTSVATDQDLINANLNIQFTDNIGLDAVYSNFGIQNTVVNDSLRVRNVGQNFSLTPSYSFGGEKATNTLVFIASLDQFRDLNIVSGALNDNDSRILNLTYSHARKQSPLTLTSSVAYFNIVSSNLAVNNTTFTFGSGYSFFKKKLTAALSLTGVVNNQALADNAGARLTPVVDQQLLFNFRTAFRGKKGLGIQFDVSNNRFTRGGLSSGTLSEITGRMSVQQAF